GGGDVVAWLASGALPDSSDAEDAAGYASGVLTWDLELPPGGDRDVVIEIPLGIAPDPSVQPPPRGAGRGQGRGDPSFDFATRMDTAAGAWREKLGRVEIHLPTRLDAFARTVRSSLGWILVERDG